ncbi:MAG: GatB/YqeY domain-containing protein [candidate division Zixibacteria bacterium]|nr:GatB/YqeY domain-containing protein [candidate division Zixibacteria bacterium]
MSLLDTLNSDLKKAIKSRNSDTAELIRSLKSDIKYKEIEKKEPLIEEEIIAVLSSAAKKRREAIEQFQAGGRDDLVQRETRQLDLIINYLPKQMSDDEISEMVQAAIEETGAATPADLGKVMKVLMPRIKGRADGSKIRQIVFARLSG